MSDYNFIRFFVILNENQKNYGIAAAPSGYCKVESLNGNAVFTVSIRNLKRADMPYKLYILLRGSDMPVYAGELMPTDEGVVYKNYQTKADNVFESGFEISSLEAMHVLSEDNESVLCGYINRNMTKQARQYSDIKLNNIQKDDGNAAFEAAAANMDDISFETSLPDEIETAATPLEISELADNTESAEQTVTADTDDSGKDDTDASGGQGSLSSYVQTLARLYEGIVNAGNNSEKKTEGTDKPGMGDKQCRGYWNKTGAFYEELFGKEECFVPFDFCRNNSKWIAVKPYADNNCTQLIGLIYENGTVRYIVNGLPVYANMFCMPCAAPYMIWLPAKNCGCGITGYWLTFIDADTGRVTEPDICVL